MQPFEVRLASITRVTTLVLTVVGEDRVGLVKTLADVVSSHGGNWERSHLAELAGTFAGVVVVTVPDRRADELTAALTPLDGLLDISVRSAGSDSAQQPASAPSRQVRLELLGNDRPGIVAAVSGILAEHGLGVADLQTSTREAPMAGGLLFEATAVVTVANDVSLDGVREALEELATEILVDLSVVELD
ncbi:hypothetical protein MLP_01950 [Microlunatus phosphovorus NM-1]|uniref:ACT domain-containing protein n=1 Tax=Microlunatus phosphovorus (strain ATCC 700054 / DSM 10555 / JCM 9379 / NBRC 101784 / NCIMB 13414 / VKM Ac-1990 / NM-1) TaxID=1032480 RepID=F5XHR4_MICPN|nr:hypothetical protein MLP_01950 [Microlunatus phosphovorus NM-1]